MNRSFLTTLTCFAILISGCSIKQRVTSIDSQITEIAIVENPKVSQAGFLSAYKKALEDKGCIVRVEPPGVNLKDYEFSSTYTANWAWDLSLYMRYAQIKIYHNGIKCGEATYDSSHGGANLGKFINAEHKINELVDQLLPTQ